MTPRNQNPKYTPLEEEVIAQGPQTFVGPPALRGPQGRLLRHWVSAISIHSHRLTAVTESVSALVAQAPFQPVPVTSD